jgi:hypothetical protein
MRSHELSQSNDSVKELLRLKINVTISYNFEIRLV